MMVTNQDDSERLSTGQILGVAGIAGGVSAWLAQLLLDKPEKEPEPMKRAAELRKRIPPDLAKRTEAAAHDFAETTRPMVETIAQRGADVMHRIRDEASSGSDVSERARKASHLVSAIVAERLPDVTHATDDARKRTLKQAQRLGPEVSKMTASGSDRVSKGLETGAGYARSAFAQAAERASDARDTVAAEAPGRAEQIWKSLEPMRERMSDLPDRSHISHDAGQRLADLARSRVSELTKAAGKHFPELAEQVSQSVAELAAIVAETTKEQSAESSSIVSERAQQAFDRLMAAAGQGSGAADRVADSSSRLRGTSQRVVGQAADTSKDTVAALGWLAAAAALVYYGMLNDSQRERVDSIAKMLFGGSRELVRDIRGYDAEF